MIEADNPGAYGDTKTNDLKRARRISVPFFVFAKRWLKLPHNLGKNVRN